MKKVLFIANTDRHIILCHLPYLKHFKELGYEVHVATGTDRKIKYCDKKIKLNLKRRPYHFTNVFAIFKIRKIAKKENYTIISCHTPIGGILGRCAVIGTKLKTKVFYTAHGFHFYKNAKFINWFLYYNIEKFLSRYTDLLLTMNNEDYMIAKAKFKCPVVKINGIGMDETRLKITDNNLREKLNIKDKFVITYIAEISKRKNQIPFVKELIKFNVEKENIVLVLVGDLFIDETKFRKFISNYKNVIFVGFKENVGDYINISDAIVFPSKQEGLPLAVLEAMRFNKMIFAFDMRGCNDLIKNNENGRLIPYNNLNMMIEEIIKYKNNGNKLFINNDMEKYKVENVMKDVFKYYEEYL